MPSAVSTNSKWIRWRQGLFLMPARRFDWWVALALLLLAIAAIWLGNISLTGITPNTAIKLQAALEKPASYTLLNQSYTKDSAGAVLPVAVAMPSKKVIAAYIAPGCTPCLTMVRNLRLTSKQVTQLVFFIPPGEDANSMLTVLRQENEGLAGVKILEDLEGRTAAAMRIDRVPAVFFVRDRIVAEDLSVGITPDRNPLESLFRRYHD